MSPGRAERPQGGSVGTANRPRVPRAEATFLGHRGKGRPSSFSVCHRCSFPGNTLSLGRRSGAPQEDPERRDLLRNCPQEQQAGEDGEPAHGPQGGSATARPLGGNFGHGAWGSTDWSLAWGCARGTCIAGWTECAPGGCEHGPAPREDAPCCHGNQSQGGGGKTVWASALNLESSFQTTADFGCRDFVQIKSIHVAWNPTQSLRVRDAAHSDSLSFPASAGCATTACCCLPPLATKATSGA